MTFVADQISVQSGDKNKFIKYISRLSVYFYLFLPNLTIKV